MELVTLHYDSINVYCVCKQNDRPSGISRLASSSVRLTAGTYRKETVLENYAFFSLLVLYATLLPNLYFWSKSCILCSNFYRMLVSYLVNCTLL